MASTNANALLKERLQHIHRLWIGKGMDSRTSRYWINAIQSGEKTEAHFRALLLSGEDCQKRLHVLLRDRLRDRVGAGLDADLEADLWQQYIAGLVEERIALEEPADIERWVIQTPAYQSKVEATIQEMYNIVHDGASPDASVLSYYLDQFRGDPLYDIDRLRSDLDQNAHAPPPPPPPPPSLQPPSSTHPAASQEAADVVTVEKAVDTSALPGAAPTVALESLRTDLIDAFEEALKRPLYVHEYAKYAAPPPPSVSVSADAAAQLCKRQRDVYTRMAEIYRLYLNQALDEYTFVKRHLDHVDDPDVSLPRFESDVIFSDAYAAQMKETVRRRYAETYDEQLDDDDLAYVFEKKVQCEKIHLQDDSLASILVAFKAETDEIIDHLYRVFMDTLGRQPDTHESTRWFKHYRMHLAQGLGALDLALERELLMSLEYHDILKHKIKQVYAALHQQDILPSHLFSVLGRCIANMAQCSASSEVESFIRTVLADSAK
jgi:hypothetical protein